MYLNNDLAEKGLQFQIISHKTNSYVSDDILLVLHKNYVLPFQASEYSAFLTSRCFLTFLEN